VASVRILQQLGLPDERLLLVLNAPNSEESVSRRQLETLLRAPFAVVVPHDPAFVHALNSGQPRALQEERRPSPSLVALADLGKLVEERLAAVGARARA